MESTNPSNQPTTPEEHASVEGLIKREWTIIKDLEKLMKDPDLSVTQKTKVATVYAYHANTLNKLLSGKGEKDPFNDQNLGDYIRGVEPRIARRTRRDFKIWKRALSHRRY